MSFSEYNAHRVNTQQTTQDVLSLIESRAAGPRGEQLLTEVLSRVLQSAFTKPSGFVETVISESLANAAAGHVGSQIKGWIALHQWMVKEGYTHGNEWDLGSADRYACAMADEDGFKSFVLRTQSQTFLIAIELCEGFELGSRGETLTVPKVGIDIRLCQSPALQRPCHLGFMLNKPEALRSPYFFCKGPEDRGYVVSVRPDILGSGWTAGKRAPDWQLLAYAIQELNSLRVSSSLEQ
ncbi:hypothetical protein ACYSUW_14090 [Pseudomonas frederiksbergensis]